MRQVLERYVLGHAVRLGYELKELGTMRADPVMQGYWEFRSQGRIHETRLFGFFARPGAFVATDFKGRNEFQEASDWSNQRAGCERIWRNLTGSADFLRQPWPVRTRAELAVYLEGEDD